MTGHQCDSMPDEIVGSAMARMAERILELEAEKAELLAACEANLEYEGEADTGDQSMKCIVHTFSTWPRLRSCYELEWLWEPRDIFIGARWKRYPKAIEVYLCLVPCLPIRVYWQWGM